MGAALIAVPAFALLGWILNRSWMVRTGTGTTPMNPLSAICLVLLGISISLLGQPRLSRLVRVLCAIYGLAGLARVAAYAAGIPLGLDQELFRSQLMAEPVPNLMAWNTAVCFVLMAVAVWAASIRKSSAGLLAQVCSAVTGTIALFVISTYALDAVSNTEPMIPMALHVAILFVASTAAVASESINFGFLASVGAQSLRARASRLMLVLAMAVPLIMALIVQHYQSLGAFTPATGEALIVTISTQAFVAMILVKSHVLWKAEIRVDEAEESMRRSADFLRRILDAAPNFIFIKNRNGEYQLVNAACAEVFGTTPHELVGKADSMFCPDKDDAARFRTSDLEVIDRGITLDIPRERIIDVEGNVRWLQTVKVPVPSMDGSDTFVLGISTDVTEQIAAEEEVLRVAKEFQDLYDHAPCGYHSLDSESVVLSMNETELGWLGYRPDEIIGKVKMADLVASRESFERGFARLKLGGNLHGVETILKHKDGSTIPAIINSTSILDEEGKFQECRTTVFDISDRKAAEEEAFRAREEAERANMAKSQFLSRMSHELRTPLNSILGFSQLLEMRGLNEKDQECLSHIVRAGRHLLQLINEVLDISRIETGNLAISIEPVELVSVISEAMQLVRPISQTHEVAVNFDIGNVKELFVSGDKQRLMQVMLNLLSNAVKYNRQGGKVSVVVEKMDEEVVVNVIDWGLGISQENAEGLFQAFDRLGAEQLGIEGTGLGLTLSRGLITQMSGSLTYTPNPEGGSIFTVRLKREASPLKAYFRAQFDESQEFPQKEARVLLIEDNQANIELVSRILEQRPSVRLKTANDGATGLHMLQQELFDLVLLDLNLPDIYGDELLSRAKNDPVTSHVPIIITSADASPRLIKRLMTGGAAAYITKPVDVGQLLATVDGLIGGLKKSA